MGTSYLEFPSLDHWERIYSTSPFDRLFSSLDRLQGMIRGPGNIEKALELSGLLIEMQHRLSDTGRSYILMMFFYEKGIPDERWFVSPGNKGESVQYFPDFEERHFRIKGWFDYFVDALYYKLFSTWDLIGHFLNVKYDLEVGKADFGKAVSALESLAPSLYANLDSTDFADFSEGKKDPE